MYYYRAGIYGLKVKDTWLSFRYCRTKKTSIDNLNNSTKNCIAGIYSIFLAKICGITWLNFYVIHIMYSVYSYTLLLWQFCLLEMSSYVLISLKRIFVIRIQFKNHKCTYLEVIMHFYELEFYNRHTIIIVQKISLYE